jgi:hypothetical protein
MPVSDPWKRLGGVGVVVVVGVGVGVVVVVGVGVGVVVVVGVGVVEGVGEVLITIVEDGSMLKVLAATFGSPV